MIEVCKITRTENKCVLVITGPPGCAKSACLLTVCKSMGFSSPLVWVEGDGDNYNSSCELEQFEEFLLKSVRYSSSGDCSKIDFDSVSEDHLKAPRLVLFEVCIILF